MPNVSYTQPLATSVKNSLTDKYDSCNTKNYKEINFLIDYCVFEEFYFSLSKIRNINSLLKNSFAEIVRTEQEIKLIREYKDTMICEAVIGKIL